MGLYKQYKPQFDEILFVASHGQEERVDATLCDYDNVLCLESDELVFAVGGEGQVVRSLTAKFRSRFEVSPCYCHALSLTPLQLSHFYPYLVRYLVLLWEKFRFVK